MTNAQLYIAIGVPMLVNALLLGFFWIHMNTRFDAVNQRFDDMKDAWNAGLLRVEGVLDARLKHLEDK